MRPRLNRLLVVVATAVAAGGLIAQPELASVDREGQRLEQVAELQADGEGPTPAALADPLRALALLYEEAGRYALASATLEHARHVTRIHQGLSAADEAVLLRQQIRSEKALGNHAQVWNLEQDMVTIARQHHDDIRMLPVFRGLADDRLGVIEKIHTGERPPMIFLGCYYGAALPPYDDTRGERRPPVWADASGSGPKCTSGSRGALLFKLHTEVLMYYADAIETILRAGDYASLELRQLEKAALRERAALEATPVGAAPVGWVFSGSVAMRSGHSGGSFSPCSDGTLDHYLALEILDSCLAPVGQADGYVVANVGGAVGLMRLISYEFRSAAPATVRARAITALADWYFESVPVDRRRFEERTVNVALAFYERAYGELEPGNDGQASAEIFAPELPVTLPTLAPNPFAYAATAGSPRHIDVAFTVTKQGTAERIEMLETSRGATRAEERDLLRLVESTSFRPRIVDGELASFAPVELRYHLP